MTLKGKTQYLMGDKIKFTGKSKVLHDGLFYEAYWIEGHREGARCDVAECNVYVAKENEQCFIYTTTD